MEGDGKGEGEDEDFFGEADEAAEEKARLVGGAEEGEEGTPVVVERDESPLRAVVLSSGTFVLVEAEFTLL